jgi:malate synthase
MINRVSIGDLSVSEVLYSFVCDEALKGLSLKPYNFWQGFGTLIHDLAPKTGP